MGQGLRMDSLLKRHEWTDDQLQKSPEMMNLLLATKVWSAVEHFIGRNKTSAPTSCQVAPRFPAIPPSSLVSRVFETIESPIIPSVGMKSFKSLGGDIFPSENEAGKSWHIDGMFEDMVAPFTLLVSVLLTDCEEDDCGQTVIYPGSHIPIAEAIRKRGIGGLKGPGISTFSGCKRSQLKGKAGDVVILHPLLAHSIGVNYSSSIRHAVFFRVNHNNHHERRDEITQNVWALCEGVG
jgi:hypothetical protein